MSVLCKEEKKGHPLAHNKRTELPRHHVFFDIESHVTPQPDGRKLHTFRLAWACYWRRDRDKEEWVLCRTPTELLDFIESKCQSKDRVHVWAHNAFYDFGVSGFPALLAERGWKEEQHYFAGGIGAWFLIVSKPPRSLCFMDTMNFYQQSLGELGKRVGELKGEVDPLTASDEELIPYCRQDVVIIKKAMSGFLSFIERHDLGNVTRTLAGTSMNVFRHKFMRHPIHIHKHVPSWRLEHGSYFGGRVELNRIGRIEEPLWYLDVNSMYPFIMSRSLLPCELMSYDEGDIQLPGLGAMLNKYHCIADVTLTTDTPRYPLRLKSLPARGAQPHLADPLTLIDSGGYRTYYPVGTFRTVLGQAGLLAAMEHGCIQKIHRLSVYRCGLLFREFVMEFWERRKEAQLAGNQVDAYLYKILLNSFYGKWGQKQKELIATYACDPARWEKELVVVEGRVTTIERILGKERWLSKSEKCSYNAFPAISSAITEYAREYLWALMVQAGHDHVVYSDTDSLIVTATGFTRLQNKIGNDLGQLKIEHQWPWLEVRGPKDYRSPDTEKLKGVSKRAVYDPVTDSYSQEQFLRVHGSMREGFRQGYWSKTITKRLHRSLQTKRALAGGTLAPFEV